MDNFHTNTLQKEFSEVYKSFFIDNNLVISWANILTWNPWFTHWLRVCKIKQKIPSKCFCWVNIRKSKEITFNKLVIFDHLQETFKEISFQDNFVNSDKILEYIREFLNQHWFNQWLELNFLAEKPRWFWFSASSVFSVLIAFTVYIIIGKLPIQLLNNYQKFINSEVFEEIYKFANHIIYLNSNYKRHWSNTYAIMSNEKLPSLFFPEENSNMSFYQKNITEIAWLSSIDNLPIDYWILFFWVNHVFDEMKFIYSNTKNEYIGIQKEILPQIFKWNENPLLTTDIDNLLLTHVNFSILMIIKWFVNMLKNMYDNQAISDFIKNINECWILSLTYEKDFNLFMKIHNIFENVKQYPEESIGIMPFNIWKNGWSFLFVSKYKLSRLTIEKLVNEFKAQGYSNIILEYASWRDGYTDDGIKIEQYLSENIFSKYIQKDFMSFIDNYSQVTIDTYSEIIKEKKDYLILDKMKMRIHLNWEVLTSKELLSQHATVEILDILVKNKDSYISNYQLPPSAYSKNKNTLLTKIITPLQKLLKKIYWSELDIECMGGQNNYSIKLGKNSDIKIGIIDNVNK